MATESPLWKRIVAAVLCGDCEDYSGERKCGVCGAWLCNGCGQAFIGAPIFDLGELEHLPEDQRNPYCSSDCHDNEAERVNEALHGERR